MTKQVYDNGMVAHVWASQSQAFGRSSNGNFFFERRALYSYGSHFLVGYLMPNGVAFLNSDSYSVSTNRHQSEARSAVRHLATYSLPRLTSLYGVLCILSDWKGSNAEQHKRARREVRAYVTEHAFKLDETAAQYLLRLVGLDKSWSAIRAERARLDATKARKEAAESKRHDASRARQLLAMSETEFRAWINQACKGYGAAHTLTRNAKEVYRVWKAARTNSRFSDKQTKRLHVMWRELRATIARVERMAERKESHKRTRVAIANYREAAARFERGELELFEAWNGLEIRQGGRAHHSVPVDVIQDKRAIAAFFRSLLTSLAFNDNAPLGVTLRTRLIGAIDNLTPDWRAYQAERDRLKREAAERANAERFERERARREEWLGGARGTYWSGTDARGGALLRAIDVERDASGTITSGTLETSQGAKVPLVHALRVFRFLKLCRERGTEWHRNGRTIRVGHFHVDAIEPDGSFRAGCHTIHWPEVARLAMLLGVAGIEADAGVLESSHVAA